jgi:ribose transport system permease protein
VVAPTSRVRSLLANQQFLLLVVWLAMVLGFSLLKSIFFSVDVAANVLADWGPLVLIALGELVVVISGGIDLSVGAVVGFSGVISAFVMKAMTTAGQSSPLTLLTGVLVCMLVGAAIGLLNAVLINYARLVPFIATLVTLGAASGMSLVLTKGAPIILIVATLWAFLHKARFGRYTYAIGSNAFAARAAGINVKRHITKIFMLSGLLAGLAGFFFYLRLGGGAPTSGFGMELDAIAAVVIGGAALAGGVGRVSGTVLGALILTTVTSGLIIVGVDPSWKRVVVAVLIAIAATLQALRKTEGKAS